MCVGFISSYITFVCVLFIEANMLNSDDLNKWIFECLKNENIENYTIEVLGTTKKGDGNTGDITFVRVKGNGKSKNYESVGNANQDNLVEIELAFKSSRKHMTSDALLAEAYERENLVYKTIFPKFYKFHTEKNIDTNKSLQSYFDFIPKCYKVLKFEDINILCLENLKTKGFLLHSRNEPMNSEHIRRGLQNYAKLHAVSLAMRDQDRAGFTQLTQNMKPHMMISFVVLEHWKTMVTKLFNKTFSLVNELDKELCSKLEKIFESGIDKVIKETLEKNVEEEVILHSDCWNNNYMFKYQEGQNEKPVGMVILDWQVASVHSPVLDICQFVYNCASGEDLTNFDELLKFYYHYLSKSISEMGSDPAKVFPWGTLMEHWKKFSIYGLLIPLTFFVVTVADQNEVGDIDFSKSDVVETLLSVEPKNRVDYQNRLLAVLRHYCRTCID